MQQEITPGNRRIPERASAPLCPPEVCDCAAGSGRSAFHGRRNRSGEGGGGSGQVWSREVRGRNPAAEAAMRRGAGGEKSFREKGSDTWAGEVRVSRSNLNACTGDS